VPATKNNARDGAAQTAAAAPMAQRLGNQQLGRMLGPHQDAWQAQRDRLGQTFGVDVSQVPNYGITVTVY